jgi:hypothetical protein
MRAVRATGQRNIGAIIHQYPRAMRIRKLKHLPHKKRQLSRGQISFTDLNALDARRQLTRDISDEGSKAAQRLAVGDVVTQHYSGV